VGYLSTFINLFIQILTFAIVGRALMSWFSPGFTNPVARFLYEITEPMLSPIRRILPRAGMFDFSPIVALVLLQLLGGLIRRGLG
jgi:YggT family protein